MSIIAAMDVNRVILVSTIIVGVIVVLCIVISYFVFNKELRIFDKRVDESSDSVRVFKLDIKNDRSIYYDSKRLRDRKSLTLMTFYNKFPYSERERLINWVGRLLENDPEVEKTLDITVILSNGKKKYYTLLEATKIDLENQIIHLESHMLRSLAPVHSHREVEGYYKYTSETALTQSIRDHKKRGFMIVVKFYQIHANEHLEYVDYMVVKNSLAPLITPSRLMMECGNDTIAVVDYKVTNRTQAVQLLKLLETTCHRRFAVQKASNFFTQTAAIMENKLIPSNLDNAFEIAEKLIERARDEEAKYIFFENTGLENIESTETNYRTEVERIIRDKRLSYYYMPVYDAEHTRTLGYRSIIRPLDSFFSTIEELKNYAFKTDDDRELFSTISKNAISRFIQQKDNPLLRLFFDVSYNEIHFVGRTFSHIQDIKETNIVICLDEQEFSELPSMSVDAVLSSIISLKSNGYQVALKIRDRSELPLHPSIYESCDFLIIIASSPIPQKGTRQLPYFQNLLENILKYHKTTIAIDMFNWDVIELIVRLGVPIVSSEAISPADENVLPLPKKTIMKLNNLTK